MRRGVRIRVRRSWQTNQNLVVTSYRRAIGCHTYYPAPSPNVYDPSQILLGAGKRFLRNVPAVEGNLLRQFRSFVRVFIRKHLGMLKLHPLTDVSIMSWLDKSTYTKGEKRKMWAALRRLTHHLQLIRAYSPDVISLNYHFYSTVGAYSSFGKEEAFDTSKYQLWNIAMLPLSTFKHCRGIQGASLIQKMVMGAIEAKIEETLFNFVDPDMGFCPFIKHVPEAQRVHHVEKTLGSISGRILNTDFTAFESSVGAEFQQIVERQLFEFMSSSLGHEARDFMMMFDFLFKRPTECRFKSVKVTMEQRKSRMSGCMWTSLMNGWINYLVNKFMAHQTGSKMFGLFEGDDGLMVVDSRFPTGEAFGSLGMIIKMQQYPTLGEAGFLSMYWGHTQTQMCDPVKWLGGLGYSYSKLSLHAGETVCHGLLKAKCFSALARVPGMPVVGPISYKLVNKIKSRMRLDGLNGFHDRDVKRYTQQQITATINAYHGVLDADRVIFAALFGWSPGLQKRIEDEFGEHLGMQTSQLLDHVMPSVWRDYFDLFSFRRPAGAPYYEELRRSPTRNELQSILQDN